MAISARARQASVVMRPTRDHADPHAFGLQSTVAEHLGEAKRSRAQGVRDRIIITARAWQVDQDRRPGIDAISGLQSIDETGIDVGEIPMDEGQSRRLRPARIQQPFADNERRRKAFAPSSPA